MSFTEPCWQYCPCEIPANARPADCHKPCHSSRLSNLDNLEEEDQDSTDSDDQMNPGFRGIDGDVVVINDFDQGLL